MHTVFGAISTALTARPDHHADMTVSILVVDDDPVQRRLLSAAIERFGYQPVVVDGGREALARISGPEGDSLALIILDLVMPDLDGMAVLAKLREMDRPTPVIVQTAHGGIDTVVNAMRAGAVDFVVKPVSPERLQVSIENALKLGALEGELARVKRAASGTLTFRDLITRSPAMERVIQLGERAAASQIPILIEGESGVGKELIARAIQGTGDRRSKPFVTVNCGAIPDNLVESILFGHEKGAFTGATEKHAGKFREAHTGTLFLDEVGELPADVQVKLLRALQDGEIDPVGARRPSRIDFRLISATNRSLIDLVKEGAFREDLYYRLNVFPIRVPPLRERREEIPGTGPPFHRAICRRGGQVRHSRGHRRGARPSAPLRLAGKCPPARECDVPRGGPGRRGDADAGRISADRHPWSAVGPPIADTRLSDRRRLALMRSPFRRAGSRRSGRRRADRA